MALALTTSPTYPVAGNTVTFSVTGASGTLQGYEIVSGPSGISPGLVLKSASDDDASLEHHARADNLGTTFTVSKAGRYTVNIYDFRRSGGIPDYIAQPTGETRIDLAQVVQTTFDVGDEAYLPIVTVRGDGGKLKLTVVNDTVRVAAIVSTANEKSRIAALQSAVTTPLAALVGQTVGSIGNALQAGVNDLRAKYEAHRVLVGGVHADTDTTNQADRDDADSQEGAIKLLNRLFYVISQHMQVTGVGGGAGAPWHSEEDWKNQPAVDTADDVASGTVLLCDLRERVYERHRAQTANPASHAGADNVNVLTANTKLDDTIVAYLDALMDDDPTAPTAESEGLGDIRHKHGFST